MRIIVITLIFALVGICILKFLYRAQSRDLEPRFEENNQNVTKTCQTPKSYIFLKKHKVGSTTLKEVFGRFERYVGIQGEPPLIGPQGGCYPARINEDCWPRIGRLQQPEGIRYHFRWNLELTDKLFSSETIKVTSIRDPLSYFRSVYEYFYFKIQVFLN